jgi:phenylalanyl-tRNA synthetase beta chain
VGIDIPMEQQIGYLLNLGLELETGPGIAPTTGVRMPHSSTFRIPTFRVDLKREIDLIEEIVRMYGVDKIPSTPPRGANGAHPYDAVHDQLAEARRILVGLGLNEAQGQTLIADSAAKLVAVGDSLVALSNPLSSDMNVLRPSLLPGLLDSMRHNISHKNNDVALFEVGRVFVQNGATTKEERRVAIALTGQRTQNFWSGEDREAKFDAYDLKGILEDLLESFGLRGFSFARREGITDLFLESATIQLGKLPLGEFGQVLPPLAKKYDLRDAVFVAELNLDQLLQRRNPARSFKTLPQFPSSRRDVAMLVPEATTHDAVLTVVRQAKPVNLESVELFDIFRGKNVPEGQKSVAYAFTYRSGDKTLTDADVNGAHEGLLKQFAAKLNAVMR